MTAKEKIAFIMGATCENSHEIKERLEDGVLTEVGRPIVRYDIRAYICKRMEEESVTPYKMAEFLGKQRSNLYNFLNGKIPFPLTDIERMLWALDGRMTTEDENVTQIIKTTR